MRARSSFIVLAVAVAGLTVGIEARADSPGGSYYPCEGEEEQLPDGDACARKNGDDGVCVSGNCCESVTSTDCDEAGSDGCSVAMIPLHGSALLLGLAAAGLALFRRRMPARPGR